jgi:hypothetical protein
MTNTINTAHKAVWLLVLGFVALALFYSVIIPLFEGPDEDDHFRYAKFIADHRALPVQVFEPGGGVAGHQGWQPPLYYTLVALLIAPIDTSNYEQLLWRNYAVTFVGDPSCCGRNIYFHTDAENFPYTRTTLAVHLARLLSILFGAITVVTTWAIARALVLNSELRTPNSEFGTRSSEFGIPLAVASVVAFNPSFLFASALVSNDAMLAALSTLVLLMWVKILTGKTAPTSKSIVLLGLLIGLGILTKTTALGLIPFSMLVLCIAAWRARNARAAIIGNASMLGMIVLVSGWWFVRNHILYGDPLAYRLMTVSALFPRAGELTLSELLHISLPWLWQTFWGGPTPGDFSPIILSVLAILMAFAWIGFACYFSRISYRVLRITFVVLVAWLALILLAQIQFIRTTTGADQGRYLFPAISVIALVFVLGLNELISRFKFPVSRFPFHVSGFAFHVPRFGSLAHWLIGLFFLLALYVPFAYTLPAYARPALLSPSDLARVSHPFTATFAEEIELLGYDLDARAVKPGETLCIAFYWRALAPMRESYRVFVHVVGAENRLAGGVDVVPARGAFHTVYWKPGDTLRDVVHIPIALDVAPGVYTIQVGWYPLGRVNQPLTTRDGDTRVTLGAIKIAPRETRAYAPHVQVHANFAGQIELIGYDTQVVGDTLALALYWRALRVPDSDYTVFVHTLDADGKIVAQVDRQPQPYPTSFWDAGEQVRDEYVVPLPVSARRVIVGLYDAMTGERLRVGDTDHIGIGLR